MKPWLSLIGLGEDGPAGLGAEAIALIRNAEVVCGGARHLELVAELLTGERHVWLSPFERSMQFVEGQRGRKLVVLASGDPFFFGVGVTLCRRIDRGEMHVIPAPSSFSLAASRLGWALQEVETVSLHGRPLDLIRPHLHEGARIIMLTSDEKGPAALAALLTESGFGETEMTVLEALGGPQERVTRQRAVDFSMAGINSLNVCALSVKAAPLARVLPYANGLDDALFEHDGQLTKREVRAVTMSALAPRFGERLWDIGGGSGSISIEWLLCHPSLSAIAIEGHPERAARIRRNASQCGVPHLEVVEGMAPEALAGLPAPDVIFIGGGGSEPGVMEAAIAALRPGGRLVANGVTLEMEAVLLACHQRHGGTLTRIDIQRASPVGQMHGWRAAMPVTQWAWVKQGSPNGPGSNSEVPMGLGKGVGQ